jgi:copper chaperone
LSADGNGDSVGYSESIPVNTITKAILAVDVNATVQANPKIKLVSVETQKFETAIIEAIANSGYPAR